MPVAPHVALAERDHDEVTRTRADLLVAARTDVLLSRLVGLDLLQLRRLAGERVGDEVRPRSAQLALSRSACHR